MTHRERYESYLRSYLINAENEPDFFDLVGDIYETPELQSTSRFIQHADITLLQHILSVSYLSYLQTKEAGLDYVSVARAAMLHDLVYYDWHERGDGSHRLHGYRHPGFALKNAKALVDLNEKEQNIILRHMWPLTPTPPKYKEGFIVSMSDKYCASQEILILRLPKYHQRFHADLAAMKKAL